MNVHYQTNFIRVGAALVAGPAAAVLTFVATTAAVWALAYKPWNETEYLQILDVFPFFYTIAIIITILVGGPAWLALHRIRLTQISVFVGVGAIIATFVFILASYAGGRIQYLKPVFLFVPLVSGSCGGYVLHRTAYRNAMGYKVNE